MFRSDSCKDRPPLNISVGDGSEPGSFQVNEALLSVQAATETGQSTVAADTSMAGHNDGYRVSSVGSANGSDGFGVANSFSDGFVADQFSVGDSAQCLPYFELKGSPYGRQCEIELFQFTLEIGS